MNKILKTTFSLLVLLLFSTSLYAQEWMGTWTYSAPDAPYGYEAGTVQFIKKDKKAVAHIEIGSSKLQGIEVTQKDKTLQFSIFVDGSDVIVYLEPKGKDQLIGKASVDGSEIKIVVTRKVEKTKA